MRFLLAFKMLPETAMEVYDENVHRAPAWAKGV